MKSKRCFSCASRGRSRWDCRSNPHIQRLEIGKEEYSNAITSVEKDSLLLVIYERVNENNNNKVKV